MLNRSASACADKVHNKSLIMKRLMSFIFAALLMTTFAARADETITVSANSADISEGLDLKVVAKLFAQAKNLEEFENMLNNPDSAFCNLDLNGDGEIDYIRVVEVGEGKKRLIVLQAILAKDIYQDVASIYVEKDEADKVTVQIVGDEYIYGANYIIEPVYIYQPVIYDWFWGPYWYAYTSPWYWGYYPGWWYAHPVWAYDYYWHHCYAFHHRYSHYCSFRPGREPRPSMRDMRSGVSRRDYAVAHPQRAFSQRNPSMRNANDMRSTRTAKLASSTRRPAAGVSTRTANGAAMASTRTAATTTNRTFGSQNTATARSEAASVRTSATSTRTNSATSIRATNTSRQTATTTRAGSATTQRQSVATTTRPANTNATTSTRVSNSTRTSSATRTTATPARTSSATTTRQASTSTRTTSSQPRTTGTYQPSSTRSSGSYGGGGVSTRTSGGGGSTRTSGGGGASPRR